MLVDLSGDGASTFKLFGLLAALKAGVQPDWTLSAPSPYNSTTCPNATGGWNNLAGEYFPTVDTLADATARSSNTFYVEMADKLFSGCDLSPYVDTALSLGVTSLKAQADTIASKQLTSFMLGGGFAASPLELAGAYAAVANDGVFCPPAPVLSITDSGGKSVPVKRSACSAQMAPQVAREAVQILAGDTQGAGTSATVFQGYYNNGGAARVVAGKTGTGTAGDNKSNGALWFAGITPNYAAATGIVNVANPSAPASGLPGINNTDAASSPAVTGAIAANLWLAALNPLLQTQSWSWPGPNDLTGSLTTGIPVQSVIGQPLAAAKAALTAQGFKVNALAAGQPYCGSDAVYDSVGYQAPTVATPGSTITLCVSDGNSPYIPPPVPEPAPVQQPPPVQPPPAPVNPAPSPTPPAAPARPSPPPLTTPGRGTHPPH